MRAECVRADKQKSMARTEPTLPQRLGCVETRRLRLLSKASDSGGKPLIGISKP